MSSFPTQVTLKNGSIVTIRLATIGDAPELIDTVSRYIADSPYIPMLPSEFHPTVEEEEAWIRSFLDKANSLLLVAEHDGRIVGNIDLTGSPRAIMAHTAMVGMGMLKEWRGLGLGAALLKAAIQWATDNPILEILWLQVYTANAAGMALYRGHGFVDHGIIPRYFQHEGQYHDCLTMSRQV